ncbi:MAG TPA: toprim domain-containing protein [Candidatus Lokiarchaeia archaeon]|nr:toprim domain-containing protein [Candidatus Lokiarchaeia archaeon]
MKLKPDVKSPADKQEFIRMRTGKVDKQELKRHRKEDLADLFADLSKTSWPVIVEGKRDREAILRAGITDDRIVMLHGKKRLDVEESLETFEEVIFLLDFDTAGLEMLDEFKKTLESHGVRVNTRYWSRIREIFNGHIDCIENLRGYLDG